MKLIRVAFLIITILILLFAGSVLIQGQAFNIKVRGILLNQRNHFVPYAKVTTKLILNNNTSREFITYSDKEGNFEIFSPESFFSTLENVMVRFSTNIYEYKEKIFTKHEFLALHNQLLIFDLAFKDISRIEWHSRAHLLLYIRPLDQKNLYGLIKNNNLTAADEYINTKIDPNRQKYAYGFLGFILFDNSDYQQSEFFFKKSRINLYQNLRGHQFLKQKEYLKAFKSLKRGVLTRKRANAIYQLASIFEENNNTEYAIASYQQSLTDFKNLIKVFKFKWDDKFLVKSEACRNKLLHKFKIKNQMESEDARLTTILKKTADYCQLLNDMALYYFNQENKTDNIYFNRRLFNAMENPAEFFQEFTPFKKIRSINVQHYFEYDLQLINKQDEEIVEKRKPLFQRMDNKVHVYIPNYTIQKAFYGPIGLIGKDWQDAFNYKILRNETLFNIDALVLEANPKVLTQSNRLSGKLWIEPKNGSILKIKWSPYGITNRRDLRKRGIILDRNPKLIFTTEYQKIKNQVRFPSRCNIMESYTNISGDDYIRINTEILYKDYRFFIIDMNTVDVKSKENY